MSEVEASPGGISVTIKSGKGYDALWIVFRGTPSEVREQIAATVLPDVDSSTLTVAELSIAASERFQGYGRLLSTLGAAPVGTEDTAASGPQGSSEPPWDGEKGDPWEDEGGDAKAPQKAAEDPLIAAIKATSDLAGIQSLWLSNKEAFERDEIKAAVAEHRKTFAA